MTTKRKPQLIVAILCLAFFIGVACWYWLHDRDASIESPVLSPPGDSNVAARVPPTNVTPRRVLLSPGPRSQEEVVGIGTVLRTDNAGAIMITGVVPNSPAAAAGLAGNFLVRKIDGVATDGMKLAEAVNLVRGAVGSKVRLELFDLDANEAKTIELTRQKFALRDRPPLE